VGTALRRLADELTATLAGLIGYVCVLAALGVGVIHILEWDGPNDAIETVPRPALMAAERPTVIHEGVEGPNRPALRQSVAVR
jgi:hypothetical protein